MFKLLRSPRIDPKESIQPVYVAWRAGTTTLCLCRLFETRNTLPTKGFRKNFQNSLVLSYNFSPKRQIKYWKPSAVTQKAPNYFLRSSKQYSSHEVILFNDDMTVFSSALPSPTWVLPSSPPPPPTPLQATSCLIGQRQLMLSSPFLRALVT